MNCAVHPDVETSLRCAKCGKPICPKCLVPTPVGARCRECARLYKLPTYRVSARYYLRATGTGLGVAIAGGVLWGLIQTWFPFFYLNLILAPAMGYAIGELVSRAVNRKRGKGLAVVASTAVVISYLVSLPFHRWVPLVPLNVIFLATDLAALALGILLTTRPFAVR